MLWCRIASAADGCNGGCTGCYLCLHKNGTEHCVVQLFYMFLRLSRTVCFTQSLDLKPRCRYAVEWMATEQLRGFRHKPPSYALKHHLELAVSQNRAATRPRTSPCFCIHTHKHTRSQLHFVRERLALIEKISAQINLFTARHTRGEARLSGVSCHHTLYHLLQSQWCSCL